MGKADLPANKALPPQRSGQGQALVIGTAISRQVPASAVEGGRLPPRWRVLIVGRGWGGGRFSPCGGPPLRVPHSPHQGVQRRLLSGQMSRHNAEAGSVRGHGCGPDPALFSCVPRHTRD